MRVSLWLCFLQQSLCGAVVLAAAGRLNGLPRPGPARFCLCAALGGAFGVTALMAAGPWQLPGLLAALSMPLIAWPGLTLRCLLRLIPCQLLLMWLLCGIAGTGMRYLPAALCLFAGLWVLAWLPHWQKARVPARYAALRITYGARSLRVTALADSGNLLRDDVTGLPVIVLSQAAASRLTGAPPGSFVPGMRCLMARTAAGPVCMPLLHPDCITLVHQGHPLSIRAMLAVSPDPHAVFSALAPICVCMPEEVHDYGHDL